jgi:hypothetical protein
MKRNLLSQMVQLFKKNLILDMNSIQKSFPNRSRCSIFRDLQKIGYISSYNKAGSYYTLKSIAQFDNDGIWQHEGVFFSCHGSLKQTLKHMVDISAAGHTHPELQHILGLRVHNTLLDLVSAKAIEREMFEGLYVYTHNNPEIKLCQLDERQKQSRWQHNISSLNPYTTVEVLLAVIKQPDRSAADIFKVLSKKGINVAQNEIETIFQYYDLGKKNSQLKC